MKPILALIMVDVQLVILTLLACVKMGLMGNYAKVNNVKRVKIKKDKVRFLIDVYF